MRNLPERERLKERGFHFHQKSKKKQQDAKLKSVGILSLC